MLGKYDGVWTLGDPCYTFHPTSGKGNTPDPLAAGKQGDVRKV
jgi:hypothetical protein